MALLDGDRFAGRFRDGVHRADASDLMRRMVKENLLKFDSRPLFPERIAHTVPYRLSPPEARLYKAVTDYVREEFNRAEALESEQRAGTVGFALTVLQRRLASSPQAIHQSLRRRRERLQSRKLVIFTEHRDTLSYLQERIASLLGRRESLVVIHGSLGRADRLKAQEAFRHDPEVQVLLATDAAGEGINLQRAHLMVNYDLPWNPNRLEQRFGRIHRIGQTEVCHLWNLVADETREGDVYRKLLDKLEQARHSLGGRVFDVLGRLHFEGRPLRDAVNPGCYPLGVRLCQANTLSRYG